MKKNLLAMLLLTQVMHGFAQIKWVKDLSIPANKEWNNYSTTFLGDIGDKQPLLVAAIPYNGNYSNTDNSTALDLSSENSLFRFMSTLSASNQKLFTYDSGMVYFLTPGIFPENANKYEYRILLNGKTEITGWSPITRFSDLTLSTFKKGFGFLGGYKADFDNFISAEIRKKKADSSFAITSVYWKQANPLISHIYTSKNLNDFFTLLKRPWDNKTPEKEVPAGLKLSPPENMLIFYMSADIFKKEAMEYQLIKDNKVIRNWGPNDYDNNFIWLKELLPGKYKISIRYIRQRHNEVDYDFEIAPQWQQTTFFKIIAGSLLAAFVGFIILLFRNRMQKNKLQQTTFEKEKIALDVRSVRAQLNPHFIFNSLGSVQSLINKNETEKANEYLTAFSDLLRQSLHYSDRALMPVAEEIKMLGTYLQLERLRFHFEYSVTAEEECFTAALPVLLLQPLVENAVKHGVSGLQEKGKIAIRFFYNNRDLVITIEDNGKGFDTASSNEGYGLSLTKQRINLLNKINEEQKIMLSITSGTEGTKITLNFNN